MDTVKRMKLQQMREKIVNDLDVKEILDSLISNNIVTEDDRENILLEKSHKDQARHLLDILPRKGPAAFDYFTGSLMSSYDWLYEELVACDNQVNLIEERSFCDALLLGGLPRSPPYNVKRKEKLAEVRNSLQELKRGNYVVLHGMTGSGKSCLAAAAVDECQLLVDSFKGCVYWLSVGDASVDDLLSHMVQLQEKLKLSSTVYLDNLDTGKQAATSLCGAKDILKCWFADDSLREGLLILDDVTSHELISAFDIGCKILVTTKDIDVMRNVKGRQELIKMNEGFTETESLSLLAKTVGVSVNQLPPQARKIHQLCKGVPMIIALIGGQLEDHQEDAQRNNGRWDYYLDVLSRKDFVKIKRHSFSQDDGLFETIRMSIDSLPLEMKRYYQDFALFVEDVNIKPEVLQTLWSLNKYEVEDIMSYFIKKSLAVSRWNEHFNSCVYGVHDLLLYYLKFQLIEEERMALHKKLLDAYSKKCGGNFALLPNDNYIFSYVGYHLQEAKMWSSFQNLYLDLQFLEAKLKVAGPGDVLVDFKKYRDHIINGNDNLNLVLENFKQFIQVRGLDLYKFEDLDIVQCGLQEIRSSLVYINALKSARANPKKLYLEFILDQDIVSQPQTVPLREEVYAACFTSDSNKVLIANGIGVIHLWELDYGRTLYSFQGHTQRVVHLELSLDETKFLSCSEDGSIKIWNLEGAVCKNTKQELLDEHGYTLSTPSPRRLQINWNNMFSQDVSTDTSIKTFTSHGSHVLKAMFSNDGQEILSCSKDGYVRLWNCETGEARLELQIPTPETFASYCTFSNDNSLILFGGGDCNLYIHNTFTGEFVSSFKNPSSIIAIFCIPDVDNAVVVVTVNAFIIWKWNETSGPYYFNGGQSSVIHNISQDKVLSHELGHIRSASYVYATMTGQYLIAGASNNTISVWDIENVSLVIQYQDHSGWVRCLDTFLSGSYQLLLSGSDDRTIKIWQLDLTSTERSVNLLATFSTAWDNSGLEPWLPLLATPDSTNKLQVLRGSSVVAESPPELSKITLCELSTSGQLAVFGCADGQVKKFDVMHKVCTPIMRLPQSVQYLQLLQWRELIVAAGDNTFLKIWKENETVLSCCGQNTPVVHSFLLPMNQQLLSCSQDASVKLWDTMKGTLLQVVAGRVSSAHITSADMTHSRDLLVLGDADNRFHMASLQLMADSPFVTLKCMRTVVVESSIRSCRISPDAQLLALGQDCGTIILWDLECNKEVSKLILHKSWVRSLRFAPISTGRSHLVSTLPVLLVSVGEQVGWWDVSSLLAAARRHKRRSGSRHRRTSVDMSRSTGGLILSPPGTSIVTVSSDNEDISQNRAQEPSEVWIHKEGRKGKPELLGCIKLVGTHALHISTSPDFSAFATIDASGIVYLMKVLQ